MVIRFINLIAFVALMGGCCSSSSSSKTTMESRHPEFFRNTDYFEISLDFWEKVEQSNHENELKLFKVVEDLGFVDSPDAREKYGQTLDNIRKGHLEQANTIRGIRKQVNPVLDRLFYYFYWDKKESSNSNDGILIVRHGTIRERIILNGKGAVRTK